MKKTWISRLRRRGPRARQRPKPRLRRRLVRALAIALVLGFVAPALPISLMRVVPPLGSALMVQRWLEARGEERRFVLRYDWVPLSRISPALRAAVVVSEDQRFYQHRGFDWESMGDALRESRDGGRLRGASTISQQLAKNLFLWPGRSLLRKALEAWLTFWLETLWPKQRILEVYLNVAQFGDGVFGVEAASRLYFGKPAAALTRRQSATLAAVLPNPRRLRAASPSPYVLSRIDWILDQMRMLEGSTYVSAVSDG